MINIVRKFSAFAITGTFSMILAACYGTPMDLQSQKRVTVLDPENNPIEGLELTLKHKGDSMVMQTTDQNGDAYFSLSQGDSIENFEVTIVDKDGDANGGNFFSTALNLNEQREITINLQRK